MLNNPVPPQHPRRIPSHSQGNGATNSAIAETNSRQIQHWTRDLPARLAEHAAGRGARLLAVITDAGIGWHLARTWTLATRAREREIKRQRGLTRCCPACGITPRPTSIRKASRS